jgi:hypothetical protein
MRLDKKEAKKGMKVAKKVDGTYLKIHSECHCA